MSSKNSPAAQPWSFRLRKTLGRQRVAQLSPAPEGFPARRALRVYAQDPGISRQDGAIHTVSIPNEALRPGPVGSLLVVEDIQEDAQITREPVNLDAPQVLMQDGLAPSSTEPKFMQQMVYAVAMETYEHFMLALGRDPGFGPLGGAGALDGRLRIQPNAFDDANAYYDREAGAIKFGSAAAGDFAKGRHQPGSIVYTALSRDIVAHEVTHALLDGLRPNFMRPTHIDVSALHEGLADLVALFLRFTQRAVVARAIENSQGDLKDKLLTSVGAEFGRALIDGAGPLRSAITMLDVTGQPVAHGADAKNERQADDFSHRYEEALEEHDRGAVLLSAGYDAFMGVFEQRTKRLRESLASYQQRLSPQAIELLAKEASSLAEKFLEIIIRAIDYCPPFHCTFGEYLRAVITADHDLVGDEGAIYREILINSFRRFGITVPDVQTLSEESLLWRAPSNGTIRIPALEFKRLGLVFDHGYCDWPTDDAGVNIRRAANALGAAICTDANAYQFGLTRPAAQVDEPCITSLRPLRRITPDRRVTFDLVAGVIQKRRVREGTFLGGSTIVVSSSGEVRYAIAKHIDSLKRLRAQRQWLKSQEASVRDAAWSEWSVNASRLQRRIHRGHL